MKKLVKHISTTAFFVATSLSALCIPVILPAQGLNLIQNGSFENTNGTFIDNGQGAMSLNPSSSVIPNWITINAEMAWVSNSFPYFSTPPTTPFGAFYLDLTGYHDSSPYGGVAQSINTTIGQQYNLSFYLGTTNFYPGPISVVSTTGSSNQTFAYNPSGSGSQWGKFNYDFTATSSSTTISFLGTSTANTFYIGLDNVSVTPLSPVAVPFEFNPTVGLAAIGTWFLASKLRIKNK
jgi:hypothetical protein